MLQVICGFIAGLALAGFGFWLAGGGVVGAGVAVVLAGLGYVAVSTLTEPERRIGRALASALPNGQKAADAIDAANARLRSIATLTSQVRDASVRAESNDFIVATRDLVNYVTRDTSAYQTLRHYITVYGEQTEQLLRSYVDVESSGARDQITKARTETIEALQVLEQTAAGELSRAVSAKTLGIAADSDAIQRLARMDGYDAASQAQQRTAQHNVQPQLTNQREQSDQLEQFDRLSWASGNQPQPEPVRSKPAQKPAEGRQEQE